jgi:hypothetical protein
MMNQKDNTIKELFRDAAAPRKEFLTTLKTQVVAVGTSQPRFKFIASLLMKLSSVQMKYGAIAAVFVLGIGAIATYQWIFPSQQLSAAEQLAILNSISGANASKDQDKKLLAASASGVQEDAAQTKLSAMWYQDPKTRGYVYKKTTNSYEFGRAAATCPAIIPSAGTITKEEYSLYYSDKNAYVPDTTKNFTYIGANSDVYDYNLTVGTSQWQYKGGSYAVLLKNIERMMPMLATTDLLRSDESNKNNVEQNAPAEVVATPSVTVTNPETTGEPPTVSTVPTEGILPSQTVKPTDVPPVTITPSIDSMFGENAKVVGTTTVDGRKVYRIQQSYQSGCNVVKENSTVSTSTEDTILVETLADAETFAIVKDSYFRKSYAANNLVYARTTKEETNKELSAADAAKLFAFEYDIQVKEIDTTLYSYESQYRKSLVDYLQQKQVSPLLVVSKGYSLQSVSSPSVVIVPEQDKHLIDRAFYSSKPYGQAQYDDSKDMFQPYVTEGAKSADLQLSYENTTTNAALVWLSITQYKGTVSADDAINWAYSVDKSMVSKIAGSYAIMIDGKAIPVTVHEQQNQVEQAAPGSEGALSSGVPYLKREEQYITRFIVVTYNDTTSVIMTSVLGNVSNASVLNQLTLTESPYENTAALEKVLTAVQTTARPLMMKSGMAE